MLNDFNNIKKSPNELAFDFNVRFQKGMYKKFQVMRLNEDVCLTTYFNAFDSKMDYFLRDKVIKFSKNNVVTGEEHLKKFIDMLNDYEVEHEDVVMKLFVHSLTEDARDWFRRFLDDSINSWNDLETLFKEKYGEKKIFIFMSNDFNNIKRNPNESAFDFNVRFQKGM